MTENATIEKIEQNLGTIQNDSLKAIEKEIEELKKAKRENTLQKRIEQLENEIEQIKKFIEQGGLDKKIEEAKKKLDDAKNRDTIDSLKGKPTLVDFWADWCAPCRFIGQTVHQLEEKYKDKLNVLQIDTETKIGNEIYMKYAKIFNVNAIPFLLLFDKEGNYADRLLGADPNKLTQMVEDIVE
ncbi:MAG: redoxin domain-containing protein [Candidatus Lokiarchaeota archaeon]|nr:redoxin domain-containing protein [Candidatus Lokiarchaeota archaeon]